jgi:hypothetical protein
MCSIHMTDSEDVTSEGSSIDPGDRREPGKGRTGDRRRGGWRDFRKAYPGFVFTLLLALAVMLALDAFLIVKRRDYSAEVARLQSNMSDQERAKTAAIIESEENKTRIALALARRQAKLERGLHLSISLDSGMFYLEREGAILREMPIAFGPEAKVGPDSIPVVIPRGETSVVKADADGIVLDAGATIVPTDAVSLAQDSTAIPPGILRVRRSDLDAIMPNLKPGVRVFFY